MDDLGAVASIEVVGAEIVVLDTVSQHEVRGGEHRGSDGVVLSQVDTLYITAGGAPPFARPVMTYYHGLAGPPMVFSGFPIWYFRRTQCTQVVDFVLRTSGDWPGSRCRGTVHRS